MATNTDGREEIKPVAPTEQTKWRDPSLVGKYMVDPKTGLAGLFRSPDNGETWVLTDTVYGHVYNQDEVDNIWDNGAGHKVADEIKSATADLPNVRKQADSAVKFAESAIAASKVNSDAIVAQSSAVVEAKSAMDSATAEIQQLKANAASDVAQIESTIAEVQAGVNQAKSANESAVQAVQAELKLTSDSMDKVEKRLDEVDTSLDAYAKSAAEQGHDITLIKQKQGQFEADFASAQGNVNQIQADIKGLRQNVKDNQGNIATLLTSADKLQASMKDAQNNISNLLLTASKYEQTFKDQDGRLSKVEQTATEHTSELADAKGNLDKVTQKADSLEATLTDAQKDINSIKVDASGIHEALTGQGKQITTINATLDGLNTKYEGVSGDLNNLKSQAQWVTVTDTVDLNNIKTPCHEFLKGAVTNAPNETAWWYLTVESSDDGNRVTQTVIADWSNNRYTRRLADDWSAWVKDATQTDVTALSNRITTNSTQITQNKQAIAIKADQSTVDNLSGEVSQNKAQLKVQADQISSKVSSTDFKTLDDKVNGMKIGGRNLVVGTGQDTVIDDTANTGTRGWRFWVFNLAQQPKVGDQLTVSAEGMLTGKGNLSAYEAVLYDMSTTAPRSNVVDLVPGKRSSEILTVSNLNGKGDTVLLIYSGKITDTEGKKLVLHHLKLEFGNVATDWTPAPEDLATAIQKNGTAIDQTNQKISLKADQTEVDQVKQTATQNSSRLDVMADQIKSKVTSTDVNNIVDSKGYATTSTVQSLITQKAGTINESITNLTNEVNTRNGVNLLKGTKDFSGSWRNFGSTNYWHTENWIDPNGNHSVKSDSLSWHGYYQPIYLDTGDYTFSGYYYSEGGKPVFCYISPNSGDNLVEVSYNSNLDSTPNGWRWFVVHFKVTKAGNAAVRLESAQNQVLHIASYKLERGTVTKPVWTPAPSDNATVTQVQQITASIDGLQSRVTNYQNDTSSKYTQLSDLVQSKVNQGDLNSVRTQLAGAINERVQKGELLSQINLTAGNTLIQSNKLYLDASSVVFSGRAFIPSAAITNIDADKIDTGVLNGVELRQVTTNGRTIDISDGNIVISSNDSSSARITFVNGGKVTKAFNAKGDLETPDQSLMLFDFKKSDVNSQNPIPYFSVTNTGETGSGDAKIQFDHSWINGNSWWTKAAGVTFGRTYDGAGGSNDYAEIYAKSFNQNSELSAKTRIEKLDKKEALDKIMQDDMYTYQYKSDVRDGTSKRYASFIIDNVNDVAQYREPAEFLSANRHGRDDGTQLAYLIAAFQYQHGVIEDMQEEIEELKVQLKEKKANE